MSRFLDGLTDAARDAGDDAARALAARDTIDVMETRIRRGVRKRRQRWAGAAAGAAVVAIAAVVAVPPLLADAPTPPANVAPVGPEVVRTDGAVTVYADGGMSVLTDAGRIVDLPAPSPDGPVYATAPAEQLCAADPASLVPGWDHMIPEARALIGYGRPQYLDDDGVRHTAVQGQQVPATRFGDLPPLAFELEVDPAVGDNIAYRATELDVAGGMVVAFGTQLDAGPAVAAAGEGTAQEVATVTMRPLSSAHEGWCVDDKAGLDGGSALVTRYLVVDVFLIDHAGSAALLASHVSWTATEVS